MLTVISEVCIGNWEWSHGALFTCNLISSQLNIELEETEKAKRVVAEERQERKQSSNDEEHLVASRRFSL